MSTIRYHGPRVCCVYIVLSLILVSVLNYGNIEEARRPVSAPSGKGGKRLDDLSCKEQSRSFVVRGRSQSLILAVTAALALQDSCEEEDDSAQVDDTQLVSCDAVNEPVVHVVMADATGVKKHGFWANDTGAKYATDMVECNFWGDLKLYP